MSRPGRAAAEGLAAALAALGAAAALGAGPTRSRAPGTAAEVIAAGCAVALAGAALGAVPVLRALARGTAGRGVAIAGWAMALRAGGTLAGALALGLAGGLPTAPFLVWVGVAYAVLLVVETWWTVRWLKAAPP